MLKVKLLLPADLAFRFASELKLFSALQGLLKLVQPESKPSNSRWQGKIPQKRLVGVIFVPKNDLHSLEKLRCKAFPNHFV
ncbi:MAG: hypothetical protein JST85_24350 [Acidobacteria bacterium]|nr:hypothetical protein [Acidobacteriota bacterium]